MASKKPNRGGSLKTTTAANGTGLPRAASEDELEFLRAIDEYQRRNQRPFPTWGEVLGVLRELGYVKPNRTSKMEKSEWQALCSSLLQERDQLQLDLAKLREENAMLKRSLGHVLAEREEMVIDEKALLEEFDKQPSLATVIAEMKAAMEKVGE